MTRPLFSDRAIQQIAENKIQQAMDDGEFENLAGLGEPLPFDGLTHDPHWWIREKLKRESLAPDRPTPWRQPASPAPEPKSPHSDTEPAI